MIFTSKKSHLFFLFRIIFFSSCPELFLTEIEQPKTDCINDGIECTYSEHIKPIFDAYCISCHENEGASNGNLSLSSFENTFSGGNNGTPIVNNLENSLLYQRIIGNQNFGGPMPPSGMISQNYINIIAKWIQDGAPE